MIFSVALEMESDEILAARERLRQAFGGGVKGRRVYEKPSHVDDRRLQTTLKKMNLGQLPADEAIMIKEDQTGYRFIEPKVHASINANTFVVTGDFKIEAINESVGMDILNKQKLTQLAQELSTLKQALDTENLPAETKKLLESIGKDPSIDKLLKQGDASDDEVPQLVEM